MAIINVGFGHPNTSHASIFNPCLTTRVYYTVTPSHFSNANRAVITLHWSINWDTPQSAVLRDFDPTAFYNTPLYSEVSSVVVNDPRHITSCSLTLAMYDGSSIVESQVVNDFCIYGTTGDYPPISECTSEPAPYLLVGEAAFIQLRLTEYTDARPATPLVVRSEVGEYIPGHWVRWKLFQQNDMSDVISVTEAVANGILSFASQNDTVDSTLGCRFRTSLSAAWKRPGRYGFDAIWRYYEDNQTAGTACGDGHTFGVGWVCVYTPFSPSVSIASITPSVWPNNDLDSNPLNGKAPFTVVVSDTSVREEYTIPLESLSINFGDPSSGTANVVTILSPSGAIPDQTHVYDGYGLYTITMTSVDVRGNTATATTQFAPIITPRVILPATLSPDTGDYPLLVSGEACVAGEPLPVVTWEYTLQGGDPDYYTGAKTGETVDISLLSRGTYTLICRVRDANALPEAEDISTEAFAVTVTGDPPAIDAPVAMNDFDIWVCDTDGVRIDIIRPACVRYTDRYAQEKSCEFSVRSDYQYISCLRKGGFLLIGYLGKARYCIVSEYSEAEDGQTVTITATDAAGVAFGSRVAIRATDSASDDGYDKQICSGEALLRYYAIANLLGAAARANAQFKVVTAPGQTDFDRGGRVVYSARYEDVTTIIEEICTSSGLGWDSSLQSENPLTVGFVVREGADRTLGNTDGNTPVFFIGAPDSMHSARIGPYRELQTPNVAVTAGDGTRSTRDYAEYGATDNSGFARREVFVDAGDTTDEDEMERVGLMELDAAKEESLIVYPNRAMYQPGVDYNVGDFVSVQTNSGVILDLQITQVDCTLDETGLKVSLQCGTDMRGYQAMIRATNLANTYARK